MEYYIIAIGIFLIFLCKSRIQKARRALPIENKAKLIDMRLGFLPNLIYIAIGFSGAYLLNYEIVQKVAGSVIWITYILWILFCALGLISLVVLKVRRLQKEGFPKLYIKKVVIWGLFIRLIIIMTFIAIYLAKR